MTADVDIEFLDDLEEFQIDKTFIRLEVCNMYAGFTLVFTVYFH